jgi:hypothetical protein
MPVTRTKRTARAPKPEITRSQARKLVSQHVLPKYFFFTKNNVTLFDKESGKLAFLTLTDIDVDGDKPVRIWQYMKDEETKFESEKEAMLYLIENSKAKQRFKEKGGAEKIVKYTVDTSKIKPRDDLKTNFGKEKNHLSVLIFRNLIDLFSLRNG